MTVIPRSNWKQWLCKMRGGGGGGGVKNVHYGLCENGELNFYLVLIYVSRF